MRIEDKCRDVVYIRELLAVVIYENSLSVILFPFSADSHKYA